MIFSEKFLEYTNVAWQEKVILDLLFLCVAKTPVERTEHLQRKQSNCLEIRDYDQSKS